MGIISKYCLGFFEVVNEIYTGIGSGIFGILLLLDYGFEACHVLRTLTVIGISGGCLVYALQTTEKLKPSKDLLVFISGCDSGLGFSLAQHMSDLGFKVIAGFLNLKSKGALAIRENYGDDIVQVHLNLTDKKNVYQIVEYVDMYCTAHKKRLHSVINNAGIMVFGEFEWLTENLIMQQINVNLLGTLLLSKGFCPLLRKYHGRFLTVSSHCAEACLPGLSVYGATKAALASWSDGLRVEMGKYGVKVVTFIPGSFTTQSNIMARQMKYAFEMHDNFTPEQMSFYEDYFKTYNTYLSYIHAPEEPKKLDDLKLYEVFENALLDESPKPTYKHEPLRYTFYHFLFRFSPTYLRDYFVTKFMQMPEYHCHKIPPDVIA